MPLSMRSTPTTTGIFSEQERLAPRLTNLGWAKLEFAPSYENALLLLACTDVSVVGLRASTIAFR
jgi:hypothetical protein